MTEEEKDHAIATIIRYADELVEAKKNFLSANLKNQVEREKVLEQILFSLIKFTTAYEEAKSAFEKAG